MGLMSVVVVVIGIYPQVVRADRGDGLLNQAEAAIAHLIRREGPITFDRFMEAALYGEGGFFASGHGAGRAGRDFVTSPEVGSLFGACVARALDRVVARARRPRSVSRHRGRRRQRTTRPRRAARRARVPRRAALRAGRTIGRAARRAARAAADRTGRRSARPVRPAGAATRRRCRSRTPGRCSPRSTSFPRVELDGVVILANELLDNLPFGIAEWDGARWHEVRVALDGDRFDGGARPDGSRRARLSCRSPAGTRGTDPARH